MNYEKICRLLKGVIDSEFNHVQEFREINFSNEDIEQQQLSEVSLEKLDKLKSSLSNEQKALLDEFESTLTNEWVNLCRFYFEQGVAAGLTNLKFLNDIDSIGSYIG